MGACGALLLTHCREPWWYAYGTTAAATVCHRQLGPSKVWAPWAAAVLFTWRPNHPTTASSRSMCKGNFIRSSFMCCYLQVAVATAALIPIQPPPSTVEEQANRMVEVAILKANEGMIWPSRTRHAPEFQRAGGHMPSLRHATPNTTTIAKPTANTLIRGSLQHRRHAGKQQRRCWGQTCN